MYFKQLETSSSLVEVKVVVGVEVEVEVEVGVEFEVEVGVEVGFLRCNLDLRLVVVSISRGVVGWSGGWSEDWRVMLNSTQDQIKLKLKFELSLAIIFLNTIGKSCQTNKYIHCQTL